MTSYVGNTPADKTLKLEKQQFTTSATTSYTLSHSVSDPQDIALFINNVRQNPHSSYTVSNTTLTLSAATASTDTMYCVFLGRAIGTVGIGAGSVTKDKVDFISDSSGSGVISKGDGSSIDGSIQLNCHVNSHGIKLKSPPHSAGQSYTLTFPQTAPSSGKFIQTDGSGNLSFADAGGGKIGQVVNVTYSTQTGNTSSSHADSGLTASITPSATDSKIYVVAMLSCGVSRNNAEVYMNLDLVRDSTIIYTQGSQNFGGYVGGASAYQLYGIQTVSYVDSPSTTSATAYKITFANQGGGSAHVQYQNTPSTMVLMEILA